MTGVMHFPLWVHGSTFAPIVNFKITSDETNEIGRSINFEFFGADNLVNQTVLPRMSLICYWEEEDLTQPANYRDQYLGWAKREATVLRLYRTRYLLETTGIAGWLDTFGGSSLYIYNPLETPDRWYEMQSITIDKCAYFILLYFSNAMTICNFYMSGNDYPSKGETIEIGAVWRQVVEMVKGYYGVAGTDSLNGIWLRKSFFYLTTDERNAIANTSTITRDKLTDDAPVTFKNELTKQVGLVVGGGSYFDGTDNTIYASAAPGLVSSDEAGEQQAPGQRLPASGPQTELNRVTGHHYAFTNNPNMDIVFELIGNDDIYEPALMLPFLYSEAMGNVAGLTVSKRFIPRSVSVTHSNRVGDKSKRVIVTAHGETFGSTAATKPVPVYDSETPPVIIRPTPVDTTTTPELDPYTADLLPTKIFMAAATSSQAAVATSITTGGTFIWTEISTGLTGNSIWGSSDPYDYEFMYLLTDTGIYRCKPYSFAGWSLVANNLTMFGNATYVGSKIIMSINRQGWIYVISGAGMAAWSNDYGATWTNNAGSAGTGDSLYGQRVALSPFNDGASAVGWMYKLLYTGGGNSTLYKSTNWGVTWSSVSTVYGGWVTADINVPYKRGSSVGGGDNVNDASQWVIAAGGAQNGSNSGGVYRSVNAGATWGTISYAAASGITRPATSFRGQALQSFTYDGDIIFMGAYLTGAAADAGRLLAYDNTTETLNTGNRILPGENSICVNGFSYHSGAILAWSTTKAYAEYSFDSGANLYAINLPSFFSASPKAVGYTEWPLVDQWG